MLKVPFFLVRCEFRGNRAEECLDKVNSFFREKPGPRGIGRLNSLRFLSFVCSLCS